MSVRFTIGTLLAWFAAGFFFGVMVATGNLGIG